MIDHSFAIRGVGTVCTGTVVEGEVKVGDEVWFPRFRKACKVKVRRTRTRTREGGGYDTTEIH
jgi:selenocysteine-specific elongation factor